MLRRRLLAHEATTGSPGVGQLGQGIALEECRVAACGDPWVECFWDFPGSQGADRLMRGPFTLFADGDPWLVLGV